MCIRGLQEQELALLFHHSHQEGWENEILHTQALFHQHSNDFFIAYKEEVLGFIIAIKESDNFGFISNLLVLPAFRGQGFGTTLFMHALKHLEGLQIGLDSVVGGEMLYKKAGFDAYFKVTTYQFLTGSVTLPSSPIAISNFTQQNSLTHKSATMQEMIQSTKTVYKAIENKEEAFALSFAYAQGYKIHIEAEDINEALTLFFALCQRYNKGIAIYLRVSPLSPMLEAVVAVLKMQVYTQHTRMYNFIP